MSKTGDVIIGQAYFPSLDPKIHASAQPYPPLGALYAASVLQQAGYRVLFHDAILEPGPEIWMARVKSAPAPVAVLLEDNFNYLSKMCLLRMRHAAFQMIASARKQGMVTIVAGSDATDHPDDYLDAGADIVILGEGEITLREVMDVLTGQVNHPLEEIRGLVYQDPETRRVIRTGKRQPLRDLDQLPFPAR